MEISELSADDTAGVADFVAVSNAVREADSPWDHEMTEVEAVGQLRYGWDLEPGTAYLAREQGETVALGQYFTSRYDNHHLAWLNIEVHPGHRRRGHGSALLEHLVARARREGRTSVGIDGWDLAPVHAFAARHGLAPKAADVNRRQHLDRLDRAALDEQYDAALPHAADYVLERLLGPVPENELAAMAVMAAAINDAPTDDLDIEDEAYPPERIRAYEQAQAARGTLHRVFARHRDSGAFAGQTVVAVDGERPWLAEQHDTSVVREHRGHRLGLLLKLDMLRWLHEAQPQIATIDTWNAASNDHMIEVNELLGYEVMGRGVSFQRSI
ncbi:N-acetyltransferase family protein [Nocardioides sp.]|uniref:GNAT family N-acetyltransferase n=1 Tax=Nocardioides sp. TaxID=35761 RepID=UPI00356710CD